MLHLLLDSISSNESSRRLGAMVDVLSSNLASMSDSRSMCDALAFSESCSLWMIYI